MGEQSSNNFLYLNREGRWPNFKRFGLEIGRDGVLQLESVPRLSGSLPDEVKDAPPPDGPAGLAADSDGTLYFTDPTGSTLNVIRGCDPIPLPFSCVRPGSPGAPGVLKTPRGRLIPPNRR